MLDLRKIAPSVRIQNFRRESRTPPTGYTIGTNGKYYKYYSTAATFDNAKAACAAEGGWLAVPLSAADNSAIIAFNGGQTIWLGISDRTTEGTFRIDSTNHPNNGSTLSYTNWNGGEPNNYGSGEDLTEMLTNGLWNDIFETTRVYVGEWF